MRLKGLEPLARSLEGCRSIQLSYRRVLTEEYTWHPLAPLLAGLTLIE